MAETTPQPTPATERPFVVNHGTPFWQVAALFVALVTGSGVHAWWTKSDSVPVAPIRQPDVIAPKPAEIDESRAYVTRDGVTLSDAEAKAIIAAVKIGDGAYSLVSYPVGSAPVVKQLTIGQSKPSTPVVVPVTPDKPVEPTPEPSKVTAVIYVYEKDQTAIPSFVSAGLNQINRKGIDATLFEADTKNGSGQIPAKYQAAYDRAKQEGLPVLVVMVGNTIAKAIKAPKTLEEITGAIQ
jgi:hypothetical protein